MKKLIVVADDLTGANDTGVQFAKQGLKTLVMMDYHELGKDTVAEVVVVNSNSRPLAQDVAYDEVSEIANLIAGSKFDVVYKKVDSTLRGNIGGEIDALLDHLPLDIAIVAPAFPQTSRVTIGGYHLLKNIPLADTEIARDRKTPVTESYLPTVLNQQSKRKVGHLSIKDIMADQDQLVQTLQRLIADRVTMISCDVWDDKHFSKIAAAVAKLEQRVLWVGSAGLAECLPEVLGLMKGKEQYPGLCIAGSLSASTRKQVNKLCERGRCSLLTVDSAALLPSYDREREIDRCVALAVELLKAHQDVVLSSSINDDQLANTAKIAADLGLSNYQVAGLIAEGLAVMAQKIATSIAVSGMVLTGGDIAVAVCNVLKAQGIYIESQVDSGIPYGRLTGGLCDGLPVVTKAGAFGDDMALVKAMNTLR